MNKTVGVAVALFTLLAGSSSAVLWHYVVPTKVRELSELGVGGPVETESNVVVGRLLTAVDHGPHWLPASLIIPATAVVFVGAVAFLMYSTGWRFWPVKGRVPGTFRVFAVFVGVGATAGVLLGLAGAVVRPVSRGLVVTSPDSTIARLSSWGLLNQSPWYFFAFGVAIWVFCSFLAAVTVRALGHALSKVPRSE